MSMKTAFAPLLLATAGILGTQHASAQTSQNKLDQKIEAMPNFTGNQYHDNNVTLYFIASPSVFMNNAYNMALTIEDTNHNRVYGDAGDKPVFVSFQDEKNSGDRVTIDFSNGQSSILSATPTEISRDSENDMVALEQHFHENQQNFTKKYGTVGKALARLQDLYGIGL